MKSDVKRLVLLFVFLIPLVWSILLAQMPGYPAPRWPDLRGEVVYTSPDFGPVEGTV